MNAERKGDHGIAPGRDPVVTGPSEAPRTIRATRRPALRYDLNGIMRLPEVACALLHAGRGDLGFAKEVAALGTSFDFEHVICGPDEGPERLGASVVYAQDEEGRLSAVLIGKGAKNFVLRDTTRGEVHRLLQESWGRARDEGTAPERADSIARSNACALCLEPYVHGDYVVGVSIRATRIPASLHITCLGDADQGDVHRTFDVRSTVIIREETDKPSVREDDPRISRRRVLDLLRGITGERGERAHRLRWRKVRQAFVDHVRKFRSNAPAALPSEGPEEENS